MPQQLRIEKKLIFAPGAVVEGSWNGAFDVGGRTYYVNNITGSASNGGLSWNNAMDTAATAVTASEAYRDIQTSSNRYIRNTIIIQGTATAYAELSDPGEHINFVGLGDNMLGNASGIARIGADSGGDTGGLVCTAEMRGDYFYNIQFQAGGNDYCVYLTKAYRSTFEYCGFFTNGDPVTAPTAGFHANDTCGGLHIKDCHWGNASGYLAAPVYGIYLNGTHWHICLVEGCHIAGNTAAVFVKSTCVNTWGSVFKDNYIGQPSSGGCTIGIDDNSTTGHIVFMNNFIDASDPIEVSDDNTRFIGCVAQTSMVQT